MPEQHWRPLGDPEKGWPEETCVCTHERLDHGEDGCEHAVGTERECPCEEYAELVSWVFADDGPFKGDYCPCPRPAGESPVYAVSVSGQSADGITWCPVAEAWTVQDPNPKWAEHWALYELLRVETAADGREVAVMRYSHGGESVQPEAMANLEQLRRGDG